MDELEHLRTEIDRVDAQILSLVQARARLVTQVWQWKQEHGVALTDPGREAALLERLHRLNAGSGLDPAVVEALFRAVLRART
jgi:chorismate mutase